jgi:flagellar biosynthesis GTPase FlhF
MSLYHKIQKAKENPDTIRTGSYWSEEEDCKLAQSVFDDKPLAEIAFEHKRTSGGIEIRLRTLAYNYYKNNPPSIISDVAKKFKISLDELSVFVRDRERYMEAKNKEKEEINKQKEEKKKLKSEEDLKLKNEREKKKEDEKRVREEEELKNREERDKEQKRLKELRDEEKKEEEEMVYNYIYCLREREFIKTKENIYKVGKTSSHPFKRMKAYPKGSELIILLKVEDCHVAEGELLRNFDEKFERVKDVGREYFKGDLNEMVKEICRICNCF